MGTIIESFGNLSDYLLTEYKKSKHRSSAVELMRAQVIRPFLPSSVRCGSGTVIDVKDRQVGPFDLVASTDAFPAFSEGSAAAYLADGVIFTLQIRDWAENDLTQFGEMTRQFRKLERKKQSPAPCLAVSFESIPLPELTQYLGSKAGQMVDGVLCVGHHVVLRNSQGWYGDPGKVPFVTEQPGPEALKAFTFFLIQLAHSAMGLPFALADYQHL